MTRCLSCDGIVTKHESVCYSCGQRIPKELRQRPTARPASLLSNLVFLASLGFAAYSFLSGQKLFLEVSLAVSGALLLLKLVDFLLPRDSTARQPKFSNHSACI
jgi:hypothetical protein